MSYANQDIHNAAGPGSSAEPSMEEILASIRRILKEDEPGKSAEPNITPPAAAVSTAPVDLDDDILVLDESMIAGPADFSSATTPPAEQMPADEHPATPLAPAGEPIHFSSEPVPFARDYPTARAMPEPVVELPETIDDEPQPLPFTGRQATSLDAAPEPEPPAEPLPQPARDSWAAWPPVTATPAPEPDRDHGRAWNTEPPDSRIATHAPESISTPIPAPEYATSYSEPVTEPTARYEPDHSQEPAMSDTAENAYQPPESLISDKATDAAASSIGALVRSMTAEKSIAISKGSSITIEDIVRDEIRPLLKSWLDSHLPSLVERIVRTEIERVISRSVV
jgi:cell pole-organizing protein PopZ